MPSWILPGRENTPVLRYKAILEKSFAYSRTFNPRNLEYHWYPLWNQTLSDLVSDVPNVIVAPQYPVWFVPQNDEEIEDDEDNGDGNDPEEIVVPLSPPRHAERIIQEHDDDDDVVADVSFASTTPENNAKSVLVDFAIINLSGVRLNQAKQKIRYGGWRITQADVGLLVEVKRLTSRSLTGAEFEKALGRRIAEACEDLVIQAGHLFLQDEGKDYVLAIAAAGVYWCSTKIYRKDIKRTMYTIQESDPTYYQARPEDMQLKWTSLVRLDLARSNDRLYTIYKYLKEPGVMRTPGDI